MTGSDSYDQEIVLARPERYFIVRRLPEDKTQPLCSFEIAYRSTEELKAMGIVPQPMAVPARETYHGACPCCGCRATLMPWS